MPTIHKLLAAIIIALPCAFAAIADETSREFQIDAGMAAVTLNEFSRQAGMQVLFDANAARGQQTQAVKGQFEPPKALAQMLSGTDFVFEFVNPRTIAVVRSRVHLDSEGSLVGKRQNCSGLSTDELDSSASVNKTGSESTAIGWTGLEAESRCKSGKLHGNLALARVEDREPVQSKDGESGLAGDLTNTPKIQEVIVTAQKREQRLQDVPISVTAFSGEELTQRGAADIKDVLGSVPGLTFSGNSERGQSQFTIRGVSQIGGSLPTTGVYLDDIALTGTSGVSGALDLLFFDIERLEVLKGPQGTLYGGTAMGGAIKYVRARPDLSTSSSEAAVGLGSTRSGDLSYKAEGVVNIPIIPDTVGVRFGLAALHEGGYIDNVANANLESRVISTTPFPNYTPLIVPSGAERNVEDYNSADTYVASASLLWQPDPSWTIRPAALYQDFNQDNPSWFFPNLSGLSASYRDLPQQTKDRVGLYNLDVEKEFSGADFYSLTSYYDRRVTWDRDYGYFFAFLFGGDYSLNGFAHYPSKTTVFSQEFRLSSKADADSRLQWLAGLYYSEHDSEFTPTAYLYDFGLPGDAAFSSSGPTTLDQYAAFGEATYRITGGLNLTVGARLYWFDQSSTTVYTGPFSPNTTISLASKENGINPKVGLSYTVNDNHILYASAAKGFRPGAPIQNTFALGCRDDLIAAGFDPDNPPALYESDNLWTYDIGSKNEFANRRFMLNGSVYLTDWKDIQQLILFPTCGQGTTVNAGAARVTGAELETRLELTPGFQIGATAGYMHTEITDPGLFSSLRKGDAIGDVPRWNTSLYSVFTKPLSDSWDLRVRADYQYQSESLKRGLILGVTYADGPGLRPFPEQVREAYDVVNASVGLTNDVTDIRLYVNNAFDARPMLFGGGWDVSFGSTLNDTLRPRTVGLEVRRTF